MKRPSRTAKLTVAVAVLAALAAAARLLPVEIWLRGLDQTLAGLGPLGPLLYAALYAAAVVAFVPGSLLTIGAGLFFGTAWGLLAAWSGASVGAALAFLVARYLARAQVESWTRRNPRFEAIDRAIGEKGWKIVALTRLSPVFPFNALNYAYGVTRVRLLDYAAASWLAMLPGTLLYVYIGSLGRAGAAALAGSEAESYRLALNVLGLLATAAVTVLVTRLARRAVASVAPAAGPQAGSLTEEAGAPSVGSGASRELVFVGAGHAHVLVLREIALGKKLDAHVTLVVDTPRAVYSGMVPGFVAGQYESADLEIDVATLARAANARLVSSAATRIDPERRLVHVADGPAVRFDLLSIDVGSTVAGLELPGVREHALSTRPIGVFVRRIGEALQSRSDGAWRVVVVGGGAGGIEIAFTLRHRLERLTGRAPSLSLVEAGSDILEGSPPGLLRRVRHRARRAGITILCGKRVTRVEPDAVVLEDGARIAQDLLLWVAGAAGHALARASDLPVEARGFLRVRSTLQVEGHEAIFAAGDCATLTAHPRLPKAGVYAVRQGPLLAANLRAFLEGRPLRCYRPQRDFLALLNLGDGTAVGSKWGLAFEGRPVMRLKDWIDRRFMALFTASALRR